MNLKLLLLIFGSSLLVACYNPYKGFDGVDDKGMGRTPPSLQISKDYKKQQKKQNRRNKKLMKKRKQELGTPEDKSKKRDYTPF